ncbi:LIM domain and RING finger protein, partial [Termitomyces sp. T112]
GNPRGGGNRGRGGRPNGKTPAAVPLSEPEMKRKELEKGSEEGNTSAEASEDADVCWICAEPVKYYSVSECNHRTCHVCALRLRALYKRLDCTFCKEPQQTVVFTTSPEELFSSYTPESVPYKDTKLSISFETQEMMEETLLLLRFNCPDPDCPYIGNGWGDLKLHVRATHGKLMCDLCIRSKKVFAHEHALYPPNVLPLHLPSMYHRSYGKSMPKDQIDGGIHPICEFCRECFFSDDELYSHMRERHEECFICKRNGIKDQYFQNYESLENHFNTAHHPCAQSQCLARKFVVFNTPLDLQAHMVEEHGSDMSSRDKKDARRIQADFEFEEVGRHGRRDRGSHRDREREPPPHRQGQQDSGPSFAPAVLRPPGPGRRREGFGANLTVEGANSATSSRPSSPPRGDVEPATLERHELLIGRLQCLAANPTTAVPVVKAAIRGYRASESSAKDFISTIWNVLDQNLEHTASIINAFVDLLDQEEKKQDLLSSWKGFGIEQRRQFPDLIPTAIAPSGTAGYAAITNGRVLNAKHATATRSAQRSSRQVWDRVAQAANATRPVDRFPALSLSSAGPSHTPAHRQNQRTTAWSASGNTNTSNSSSPPMFMPTPAQASSSHITVVPDPRSSRPPSGRSTPQAPPPKLSNALFPELRSVTPARPKAPVKGNSSLQNILGNPTPPAVSAWGGVPGSSATGQGTGGDGSDNVTLSTGKGKKGKGKQKQTLFTLGSFPT